MSRACGPTHARRRQGGRQILGNTNSNLPEEIAELPKALYRFEGYVRDAQGDGAARDGCVERRQSMGQPHEEDLEKVLQHFRTHFGRSLMELKSTTRRPRFGVDPSS